MAAPVMSVSSVLTAPLVVGLNILGFSLKLTWRMAVAAATAWLITRLLIPLKLRVKVSGFASAATRALSMLGQGVAFTSEKWHQDNISKLAAQEVAARQAEALKKQSDNRQKPNVESQAASWTPAPSAPSAPSPSPSPPAAAARRDDSLAAGAKRARESALRESDVREEINGMRVKAIKNELDSRGVSHADAVEKSDLVARLVQARMRGTSAPPPPPVPPPPAPPPPAPPPATSSPSANPFAGGFPGGFPGGPEPTQAELDGFASQMGINPEEAKAQADKMMSNPEGMALMEKMASNPKIMQAAMDIAMNGEAAAEKYANDPDVMGIMQELEKFNGL